MCKFNFVTMLHTHIRLTYYFKQISCLQLVFNNLKSLKILQTIPSELFRQDSGTHNNWWGSLLFENNRTELAIFCLKFISFNKLISVPHYKFFSAVQTRGVLHKCSSCALHFQKWSYICRKPSQSTRPIFSQQAHSILLAFLDKLYTFS